MGRPSTGTTKPAADRVKDSLERLRQAGGTKETFRLSPEAVQAMTEILETGSDKNKTALISRLLIEEAARVRA